MKKIGCLLISLLILSGAMAFEADIVVASDGTGEYTTLTDAISELPMYNYQRLTIYIKNGKYNEKVRIEQDFITLVGESRDSTIIEYNQLREDWQQNKDAIGPAVINIHADDVVLCNLTIRNTQPQLGPHAFTIYGTGTRTIITNCTVTSNGGDTVSLWNYKEGQYYHADCYFEGCVDFVCPRGWCFVRNSQFHQLKKTATLWHAGPVEQSQKFVLRNCTFTGPEGYYLGRHHYEAQFYLIDCHFSETMSDKPIYYHHYPDDPKRNRPYLWKERYYFSGCEKAGVAYNWFQDNFKAKGLNVEVDEITPEWTFDYTWNPEKKELPKLKEFSVDGCKVYLVFDEIVGADLNLVLETQLGHKLEFFSGQGRDTLLFSANEILVADELTEFKVINGCIFGIIASAFPRVIAKGDKLKVN